MIVYTPASIDRYDIESKSGEAEQNSNDNNDSTSDKVFSDYGEIYVLVEADPSVLQEAMADTTSAQLRWIIDEPERRLGDIHEGSDTAHHHRAVLNAAQRRLNRITKSGA